MGIDLKRVGAAVVTGGGSEALRYGANQLNKATQSPNAAADAEAQRKLREQLAAAYANQTTRPPPQASSTSVAPAAQTQMVQQAPAAQAGNVFVGPAAQTTATTAAAPQMLAAPTVARTAAVEADKVGASRIGNIERFGPATAQATDANAARIDLGPQGEIRQGETGLIGDLQAAARGQGPSIADAQFQKNLDKAIANQYSTAAGARGNDIAAARRNAAQNAADITGQAAAESAILKAQEQQAARGELGAQLQGTRGQDIGIAGQQAQLQQAANLQNAAQRTDVNKFVAGLQQQAAAGNAAAQNAMAQRQAELDQTANLQNSELGIRASLANQSTDAQRAAQQADLQAKMGLANQGAELSTNQFNAGQTNTVGMNNTGATNDLAKLKAQLEQSTNQFNAGATNQVNQSNAALLQQGNEFNAGAMNQANQLGAQLANQTELANLKAKLDQMGLDDAQKANILNALMGSGRDVNALDQAEAARRTQLATSVIQGGVTAGQAALSDMRAKEDISEVDGGAAEKLAKRLRVFEYKYKGEHDDGRRHFGVMAQELEKDPIGRKLVSRRPDGFRQVDYQGLSAVLLAATLRAKKGAARA